MTPIIEVQQITKRYEVGGAPFAALRDVSLSITRGEFVAIMGASGSGKSTLMHLLGCLDHPSSGRYLLESIDVSALDDTALAAVRSHQIGFVFQSFNLLARASALESVELPLVYAGWTPAGRARARQLLSMVGLKDREQSRPNELSGGQQQRVAIARALVNQPPILLADEPTGNLDSRNAAEVLELLRSLNRERGLTIVMVTHDLEVARYADRIVTFRDGQIIADLSNQPPPAPFHSSNPALPASGISEPSAGGRRTEALWAFAAMALATATQSLRRNKLRAALTMLGVFIGVAAVVVMIAIGQGASQSIQEKIRSLGANVLIVHPGTTTAGGVRAGSGSNSKLTVGDAFAIRAQDPAISSVTYVIRQAAQVVNGDRNWSTLIVGAGSDYLSIREWPLVSGRPFSSEEAHSAVPVCLLGQTVAENLFDQDENPVGAFVRIKDVSFNVIGVLAAKGQSNNGEDQDDLVIIPFLTAERRVLGAATASGQAASGLLSQYNVAAMRNSLMGMQPRMLGKVNVIYAKAASAALIPIGMQQLARTLREHHRLRPGQDDDFTVRNLADVARASENASRVMTILLAAIGSISLLVGGIGIMNIMLVSVTERTREIGVRIAVGARQRQIMVQFLVEAVLLSLFGGLTGVLVGTLTAAAIGSVGWWPIRITPLPMVSAFMFSAAVGIFFGYYPARRGAALNPVDALRYE